MYELKFTFNHMKLLHGLLKKNIFTSLFKSGVNEKFFLLK